MKAMLCLVALWFAGLELGQSVARAGLPVSEDGVQLSLIRDLHDLTVVIQRDQALSQQHLAKIRAMEEGSKAVALAMAQMNSLLKHGQLLAQDSTGQNRATSASNLAYDGQNFVGGNYGFIDNIVGQNGPIALDRILPSTLIPVSGSLLQQAQQGVASFANGSNTALLQATLSSLAGSVTQSTMAAGSGLINQAFTRLFPGQGSGSMGMLGDGVFLRPYAGLADDAYQALVESGTAAQKMQFFADTRLSGTGYNAILGQTGNPGLSMVNLDNVLSAGASQAFQAYEQSSGETGLNPYQGYASQLLPQLTAMISQAIPGTSLVPTAQQVGAVQSAGGDPGPQTFPSLFANDLSASSPNLITTPFGVSENSAPTQGVVVVVPPAKEAQDYEKKIAQSDESLKTIAQEIKTQQQAQTYTQQLLSSLGQIHDEAESLQQNLNSVEPKSIPQLTSMIRDVQAGMEDRQQDLNALSLGLEKLQEQLQGELRQRAQVVYQEQQKETVQALPRWRAALAQN